MIRHLSALAMLLFAVNAPAQDAICCGFIMPMGGSWFGAVRDCAGSMKKASEPQRAKVCQAFAKMNRTCPEVEPYCKACDEEALKKAREDYQRWLQTYKELSANRDALSDEATKVVDRGEEVFTDYFGKQVKKIVVKILGTASPAAKKAMPGVNIYTAKNQNEAVLKEIASLLKDLSKTVKGGAWKKAAPVIDIIQMISDLGFANAKMLTLLKEFDRYAKESAKAAEAALDALKKLREAKARVDALEAQCQEAQKAAKAKPPAKAPPQDEWKPSGQREFEAAQKLAQSWRRADGHARDSQGSLTNAENALQEALTLIQSQSSNAGAFHTVSLVAQAGDAEQRAMRAGDRLAVGLDRTARAIESYLRMKQQLATIRELRSRR